MTRELTFKKVKVSNKGWISLPVEIQREIGIKKGDTLLLIRKGQKIVLEKAERTAQAPEDGFADLQMFSESSLRRMWLSRREDVWDSYLKANEN